MSTNTMPNDIGYLKISASLKFNKIEDNPLAELT